MSDETTNTPGPYQADTQAERWLKYGSNVALASVVVIAIAALVIYLAEWKPKQWDTTANNQYSLKPQTIKLIEDNKQKITIVNLYTRSKPPQQDETASTDKTSQVDLDAQATAVDDLLDEYRSRGKNITIESIDPIKDPAKVDELISQVTDQYGGQVAAYKKFTEDLKPVYTSIEKQADGEVAKINALPRVDLKTDAANESFYLAFQSVNRIPEILKESEAAYRRALRERIPNYKAVTDDVEQTMPELSTVLGLIIDGFKKTQADKAVPEAYRKYVADDLPVYVSMKKQIDDLVTREKGLGELKLDTLKTALAQRNPILVRGETAWKVIPYDQVWHTDVRDGRSMPDDTPVRPRFSGEQAITTAILGLTESVKPKVCFVRSGGPPLSTDAGMYTTLGERLRAYNYDVTDKDLTGQYAMMAAQQQQMAPPEPTDADIADAIWVVDGQQQRQQSPMAPTPPPIGQSVADHIAHGFHYVNGVKTPGGMAMFIPTVRGEDFTEALSPFGISVRTDVVCVHEPVGDARDVENDIYNLARALPFAFVVNDWGTSPITTPVQSLPGVLVEPVPVKTTPVAGVTSTALVPIKSELPVWGETDLMTVQNPKQNKDKDVPGPFFAAASAEKTSGGTRVVVFSSPQSFSGAGEYGQYGLADMDDPALRIRGIHAPAFPGDSEFFMNSIYWLGHRESMIAMSPAAMTVDRIGPMSAGVLGFWRIGILLLAIPGLAVAIGAAVFYARRG
jgi:hypothetical protein